MGEIGIIGSDGFLGSYLSNGCANSVCINRDSYDFYKHKHFDILINANGNSKRYFANNNILDDFNLSTKSVYDTIFDFSYNTYMYISSTDIYYKKNNPYGFHKYLSELIVKQYCENYCILRCSTLIGNNMKKGVIKDIIDGVPLYITGDSELQFIDVDIIGRIINNIVNLYNSTINIGGIGTVKISDICTNKIRDDATYQYRYADTTILEKNYSELKSSEFYVKKYLDGELIHE